jgi:hypothetical protein
VRHEPRRSRRPVAYDVHGNTTVADELQLPPAGKARERAHAMKGGEQLELVDTRAFLSGVEESACRHRAVPDRAPSAHTGVCEQGCGRCGPYLASNVWVCAEPSPPLQVSHGGVGQARLCRASVAASETGRLEVV